MNYEDFKRNIEVSLTRLLLAEYPGTSIRISAENGINNTECILIKLPNLYNVLGFSLQRMYSYYDEVESLDAVAERVISECKSATEGVTIDVSASSLNALNIVFELINTEQNEELIGTVPHREFLDLTLIYKVMVEVKEDGRIGSTIVDNKMAEKLDLSEEELFSLAYMNTPKNLSYKLRDMNFALFALGGIIVDETDEFLPAGVAKDADMYALTSKYLHFGATAMLYGKLLDDVANYIDSSFYILPSSVQELIFVRGGLEGLNAEELAQMVYEINMTQISQEERLSNSVYFYDKTTKEVSIAFKSFRPLV